jgi:serine/threonine-protein kinase
MVPAFAGLPRDDARGLARYAAQALRAYAALARGDTGQALARFGALPDTSCHVCAVDRLTRAQLLAARGQDAAAAAILDDHRVGNQSTLQGGLWALERARVHERLGHRAQALEDYRFVAAVWRHADPELQPFVSEAGAALQRLGAEPRP